MIYELRTYNINTGAVPDYLTLFSTQGFPLLCEVAEPVGYWIAETGRLNRVFHMWRYQDRAHRAAQRAKLMANPDWAQAFLPNALPFVAMQSTQIFSLADGVSDPLAKTAATPGLFEIAYVERPDTPATAALGQLSQQPQSVGLWTPLSGALSSRLWITRYDSDASRDGLQAEVPWRQAMATLTAGAALQVETAYPAKISALQ